MGHSHRSEVSICGLPSWMDLSTNLQDTSHLDLELAPTPFGDGRAKGPSGLSGLPVEQDSTASSRLNKLSGILEQRRKRSASPTLEYLHQNKRAISNDKSRSFDALAPSTLSSATSGQGSASKGRVCAPFWTKFTTEWSRRLPSCTRTDCVDSPPTSWPTSLSKLASNSWFSVQKTSLTSSETSQRTFSPLPRSLWQDITEDAARKTKGDAKSKSGEPDSEKDPDPTIRARKIRVFPDKEQAKTLENWFGAFRCTYNNVVEFSHTKPDNTEMYVKPLRAKFMNKEKTPDWMNQVPYDVRDGAVLDFDKARRAQFAKQKLAKKAGGSLPPWTFKFKSRKDNQCITIRGRDWGKKRGVYTSIFRKDKLTSAEDLPEIITRDFRLVRDKLGHYFLCLPREVPPKSESQAPRAHHSTVALDPGVRTFQTCYDADGEIIEWGKDDMKQLFQLCHLADRLQGRIKQAKGTKRRRRRLAWLRLLERIRNMVNESHKKLATFLCENYRIVLIPKFETQRMVRRRDRKLNSKTARGMCTWAHFRFRQRLNEKAELYPWCKVIECDEAFTSKTCGGCGHIHAKLGSSKTFICPKCGYEADRDGSASRNILLRYLTKNFGPSGVTALCHLEPADLGPL